MRKEIQKPSTIKVHVLQIRSECYFTSWLAKLRCSVSAIQENFIKEWAQSI